MASGFSIFLGILLLIFLLFVILYLIYFLNNNTGICISKDLATPTNFSAKTNQNGANTDYVLTWTPVTKVDGYVIFQGSSSNFTPSNSNIIATINSPSTATYTGSTTFGGTYYFLISSFAKEGSTVCYSAPSTVLSVPITTGPIGIKLFVPSGNNSSNYCAAFNGTQSITTTKRSCPYSIATNDNSDKNGGYQIGFQYTTTLGSTSKFIFNSSNNIIPASDTTQCIYYNVDASLGKGQNVPCYTTCSSIPDKYKQWNVTPTVNGSYLNVEGSTLYIAGYSGEFEQDFHGPFGYTSQPSANLDCSVDIFPLWTVINQ